MRFAESGMVDTPETDRTRRSGAAPRLVHAAAILTGLGVPLLAFGPGGSGVALALALVIAIAAPGRGSRLVAALRALRSPLGIMVIVAMLLLLPAVVDSLDPMRSLRVWGRMLLLLAGALVLFQTLRAEPKATGNALKTMVVASIVCGTLLLVGRYGWQPLLMAIRGQGFVPFEWAYLPKGYGSVIACLIPAVVWAGFRLGGPWRWLGLAYLPLGILLIIGLDSSAGLFGLAIGLVIGAIAYALARHGGSGRLRLFLVAVGLLAATALGVVFAHLPQAPPVADLGEPVYTGALEPALPLWVLDGHRQFIWAFALERVGAAPVIGHGIDLSNYLPGANVMLETFKQQALPGHPHDWILELLVDSGALGLLALVAPLLLLVRAQTRWAATDPAAACAAIAVFAAFWSTSLLTFSIWSTWWQGVFLILTAITCAAALQRTEHPEDRRA
jgi:O-antigen ligase